METRRRAVAETGLHASERARQASPQQIQLRADSAAETVLGKQAEVTER
jgi:hypothetical protein